MAAAAQVGDGFKKLFRIRITLPTLIVSLIGGTMLLVASLSYFHTAQVLRTLAFGHMGQITDQTIAKTMNQLQEVETLLRINRTIVPPGVFGLRTQDADRSARQAHLNDVLEQFSKEINLFPATTNIHLGDEQGNFYMVSRREEHNRAIKILTRLDDTPACAQRMASAREAASSDGTQGVDTTSCVRSILIHRTAEGRDTGVDVLDRDGYDPRVRPWYTKAKETGATSWTPVYLFHQSRKPGITASLPVYMGEDFAGVLGVDIELSALSQFLSTLQVGKNGRAFIIHDTGEIIAYPDPAQLARIDPATGAVTTRHIRACSDNAAYESYKELVHTLGGNAQRALSFQGQRHITFTADGMAYLGSFAPLSTQHDWKWYIGVIMPEDDFLAPLKRNNVITMTITLCSMVAAILLGILISRRITRPLTALTQEAERIRRLDLDSSTPTKSFFMEIQTMARSFEDMKSGLRSFRKFVPADVVSTLIASGHEANLDARHREVTLFFSDIVGFTSVSETMPPQALVEHLGDYLDTASRVIHAHNGTVDKFIGDAVMAFWNAPGDVPDHPAKACAAALAVLRELDACNERWRAAGLPALQTRIGLHCGSVLVGNMGAQSRLNYTVIGDTVNLASRLEGLGKHYAVRCVVSEAVVQRAPGVALFRRLDTVAVKGKQEAATIYEMICALDAADAALRERVARFEDALARYQRREFAPARDMFLELDTAWGGDGPSRRFAARCEKYLETPPPADWEGIHRFTSK
ncbi:MAG: adenylate/guanylate cyclase domain-containing protein [Desulfovibrionaceae bacterium]